MFAAATDTTYTALVWAMAELMNHSQEMRPVQDEIRAAVGGGGGDHVTEDHLEELCYLKCVIKETLRIHPPLPLLLPRETMEDTELLGYQVPARTAGSSSTPGPSHGTRRRGSAPTSSCRNGSPTTTRRLLTTTCLRRT
ncbi:hypothetical protein BAE44_0025421 [Dichanthelium oligosanthes]|uniref:Uncharacterized protein n=1 Tax=Dichanthelium oligosanthes TaxID=888268 RepID=A0A1E5UL78_9POAL|nr:hypothetical protein BAE44_0025421 [Dichanthelium oligosanthes]